MIRIFTFINDINYNKNHNDNNYVNVCRKIKFRTNIWCLITYDLYFIINLQIQSRSIIV